VLAGWLTRQARPLPAGVGTRGHLLRARLSRLGAVVTKNVAANTIVTRVPARVVKKI
jgi:hypothetical protein